jgi:hypothetical protein
LLELWADPFAEHGRSKSWGFCRVRRLNFAARRFRTLLDALLGCLGSKASAPSASLSGVPNIRVG